MLEQSYNSRNTFIFLSGNGSNISDTAMRLIIWTIQLFEHPPFPEKVMYSKHLSTHVWNYSNIWTPTPCGARSAVAECLQDLDSLCGATARVTECLLAYYRHLECLIDSYSRFQISTKLILSLWSSNRGYQTCIVAFDGLCRAWTRARTRVVKCVLQSLQSSNRS